MTERSTGGPTPARKWRAVAAPAAALVLCVPFAGCGSRPAPPPVPEEMPPIVAGPPAEPVAADEGLPGRWERTDAVSPAGRLFVVAPEGTPRGGLLLIHGAWGVNADVRTLARDFAARGYAVAVPDIFDGLEITTRLAQRDALAGVDGERALALIAAADARLREEPSLAESRLGMLALSTGAGWAMRYAESTDGIGALVVDDAVLVDDAAPRGPVGFATLLLVGELDRSIDANRLAKMRQAFADAGASLEVARIPGTGTDLLDPRAFGFSEAVRPLAFDRAVAFLDAHLGPHAD